MSWSATLALSPESFKMSLLKLAEVVTIGTFTSDSFFLSDWRVCGSSRSESDVDEGFIFSEFCF